MINALFNGLLKFLTQIITILLTPLNSALEVLLPDLSSMVSIVNQFWAYLSVTARFVLSYTGIYRTNIAIICTLLVLNITIPWTLHGFKLIVKWWEALI